LIKGTVRKNKWRPKWFILQGSKLWGFKSKPQKEEDEPTLCISLNDANIESLEKHVPKIMCFAITVIDSVLQKKISHVFGVKTKKKEEYDDWFKSLKVLFFFCFFCVTFEFLY
jgi:hypothetical protein